MGRGIRSFAAAVALVGVSLTSVAEASAQRPTSSPASNEQFRSDSAYTYFEIPLAECRMMVVLVSAYEATTKPFEPPLQKLAGAFVNISTFDSCSFNSIYFDGVDAMNNFAVYEANGSQRATFDYTGVTYNGLPIDVHLTFKADERPQVNAYRDPTGGAGCKYNSGSVSQSSFATVSGTLMYNGTDLIAGETADFGQMARNTFSTVSICVR